MVHTSKKVQYDGAESGVDSDGLVQEVSGESISQWSRDHCCGILANVAAQFGINSVGRKKCQDSLALTLLCGSKGSLLGRSTMKGNKHGGNILIDYLKEIAAWTNCLILVVHFHQAED